MARPSRTAAMSGSRASAPAAIPRPACAAATDLGGIARRRGCLRGDEREPADGARQDRERRGQQHGADEGRAALAGALPHPRLRGSRRPSQRRRCDVDRHLDVLHLARARSPSRPGARAPDCGCAGIAVRLEPQPHAHAAHAEQIGVEAERRRAAPRPVGEACARRAGSTASRAAPRPRGAGGASASVTHVPSPAAIAARPADCRRPTARRRTRPRAPPPAARVRRHGSQQLAARRVEAVADDSRRRRPARRPPRPSTPGTSRPEASTAAASPSWKPGLASSHSSAMRRGPRSHRPAPGTSVPAGMPSAAAAGHRRLRGAVSHGQDRQAIGRRGVVAVGAVQAHDAGRSAAATTTAGSTAAASGPAPGSRRACRPAPAATRSAVSSCAPLRPAPDQFGGCRLPGERVHRLDEHAHAGGARSAARAPPRPAARPATRPHDARRTRAPRSSTTPGQSITRVGSPAARERPPGRAPPAPRSGRPLRRLSPCRPIAQRRT